MDADETRNVMPEKTASSNRSEHGQTDVSSSKSDIVSNSMLDGAPDAVTSMEQRATDEALPSLSPIRPTCPGDEERGPNTKSTSEEHVMHNDKTQADIPLEQGHTEDEIRAQQSLEQLPAHAEGSEHAPTETSISQDCLVEQGGQVGVLQGVSADSQPAAEFLQEPSPSCTNSIENGMNGSITYDLDDFADEQMRHVSRLGKRKRSDDLDVETTEDSTVASTTTSSPPASKKARKKRPLRCSSDPHDSDDPVNVMIYELRKPMDNNSGWPQIADAVNRKHKGSGMDGRPLPAMSCYTRFMSTAEQIAKNRSEPYQRGWYMAQKGPKPCSKRDSIMTNESEGIIGASHEINPTIVAEISGLKSEHSIASKRSRDRCPSDPHDCDDPVNIMIYELRTAMDQASGWEDIATRVNRKYERSGRDGQPLAAHSCRNRFMYTAEQIASARSEPYQREWYIAPRGKHASLIWWSTANRLASATGKKSNNAEDHTGSTNDPVQGARMTDDHPEIRRDSAEEEVDDSAYSSFDDSTSLINDAPVAEAIDKNPGRTDISSRESPLEVMPGALDTTPDELSADLATLYKSVSTRLQAAKTICDHEEFDALRDHFDDEMQGLQFSLRRVQRLLSSLPERYIVSEWAAAWCNPLVARSSARCSGRPYGCMTRFMQT